MSGARRCLRQSRVTASASVWHGWISQQAASPFWSHSRSRHLDSELERLKPAELLVSESARDDDIGRSGTTIRTRPPWYFELSSASRLLTDQLGTLDLKGFGADELPLAISAAGALLQYVKDTQRAAVPHIRSLSVEERTDALIIDATTRRNLELDGSNSGNADATLFAVIDHCVTAMGSRQLRRWLNRPLTDHATLEARYHALQSLIDQRRFEGLREALRGVGDIERILSRVALRSARPRDLTGLRASLSALPPLRAAVAAIDSPLAQELYARSEDHSDVVELLTRAVAQDPSTFLRDGDVIAEGYDADLDELRQISTNTDGFLLQLEQRERERSGIPGLKLGFNRVQGFFIEISRKDAENVPKDYIRRQTVKSAERFITPELKTFEDKVLSARDRALAREKELYDALLTQLIDRLGPLQKTGERARRARFGGVPGRASLRAAMVEAGARRRAGAADHGRPPSDRRTIFRFAVRAERSHVRQQSTHADHHRPEHGR